MTTHEPRPAGAAPRRHAARRERLPAQPRDRPDRLPHRRRPVRDPGHPAVARPRLRRDARPRWALPSTPARSAWRWRVSLVAFFSRRIDRARRHRRQPRPALGPDHPARDRAGPRHLHRPAGRAGHVHVGGVHADAGLSRRALQRRAMPPARSPPTSPATSRATCSAGCCRRRSPTISGLATNFYVFAAAQSERCRAGLVLARAHAVDDGAGASSRPRRSRPGPSICATRRCAAASPSAS